MKKNKKKNQSNLIIKFHHIKNNQKIAKFKNSKQT